MMDTTEYDEYEGWSNDETRRTRQWVAAIVNVESNGLVEVNLHALESDELREVAMVAYDELGDSRLVKVIAGILRSRQSTPL